MPRREKGRAWLFLNGLKVPNRGVFCRITGQVLQSSLMVAFFAAVLSEGSGVESYVVAPPRCRVVAFPCRKKWHAFVVGRPSSRGWHASTIMQSVMNAEERGYPMDKELFDYVVERAEVLATNDASTQVTKDAAAAWKAAVAADASDEAVKAATDKLLDVLEGRPTTIDGVIAFAEDPAKQLMGEEVAAAMLAEQLKRKEAGAKYCNCPSCTAASELLAKFGRIEL